MPDSQEGSCNERSNAHKERLIRSFPYSHIFLLVVGEEGVTCIRHLKMNE